MEIKGLTLVQTCGACPEVYEVYKKDKLIGYMRLRHGRFSVNVPYTGGEEIMSGYPKGDGIFEFNERMTWLHKGVAAIKKHLKKGKGDE